MAATYIPVTIQLTNRVKDFDGNWVYGCDSDTYVERQIALIAPGVTVRVFPPSTGYPGEYSFSWYISRPDIRWEFVGGHVGTQWETAAKQRASEAASITAAKANETPQKAANGQWWPTSGAQS